MVYDHLIKYGYTNRQAQFLANASPHETSVLWHQMAGLSAWLPLANNPELVPRRGGSVSGQILHCLSMTDTQELKVPTKVPMLIAAAVVVVAVINYDKLLPLVRSDNTPKPVDISFSLDCRELEGPVQKPLLMSIEEYEKASPLCSASAYAGKADGGAVGWLFGTSVAEVTDEIIVIKGSVTSIGSLQIGSVDRRTGHADLSDYSLVVPPNNNGKWENVTKKIWKQYTFECEPSKPAKF